MAGKLPNLPRASVQPDALVLLGIVAARRQVQITDLIREGLKNHPDVIAEAAREKISLEEIFEGIERGGQRV